jgi:hypothetical protein
MRLEWATGGYRRLNVALPTLHDLRLCLPQRASSSISHSSRSHRRVGYLKEKQRICLLCIPPYGLEERTLLHLSHSIRRLTAKVQLLIIDDHSIHFRSSPAVEIIVFK